jgi:hypothetical protein
MDSVAARAPWHLWAVGAVSLLWNAGGAFDYLMSKFRAEWYMSQFTPEQLAYFDNLPFWMNVGWALGIWGSLAGSLGLLLRKGWAVWAFGISLVGVAANALHTFVLSNGIEVMGGGTGILVFNLAIIAVAVALFFYARAMRARGLLT